MSRRRAAPGKRSAAFGYTGARTVVRSTEVIR